MNLLLNIIEKIDNEIKGKRLYLTKEHKNGIFNFQEYYDKYVPYYVDYNKKLEPLITEIRNKTNEVGNTKFNSVKISDYDNFVESFLTKGVIAKTLLIDKEGNVILTHYSKNIEPINYIGKINVPKNENLENGSFLYQISEANIEEYNEEISVELKTYFPENIRKLFKVENENFSSRIFKLNLEKENKPINLNDVLFNLKIIIERLDDTCFNIFTRVDRLNYLLENRKEIQKIMQKNFNSQERENFNQFYNENKEWFYLLTEAIDLTRNKYYKEIVIEKEIKKQTEELNEIIQFISYSLYLSSEKNHKQKFKI